MEEEIKEEIKIEERSIERNMEQKNKEGNTEKNINQAKNQVKNKKKKHKKEKYGNRKTQNRKNINKKKHKKDIRLSKEDRRRKRKRARRRIVFLERAAVVFLTLGVIGGGFAFVWNMPSVKLNRQLSAGEGFTEEAAYPEAIEAYESALEIDSTSVEAYRCMAGAYLDMADESHAKQVLYEGWENTQDESLLEYYCTVILNEAVGEINGGTAGFGTVEKILTVLDQGIMKTESLEALEAVCDRMAEGYRSGADVDFDGYERMMAQLFDWCQRDGTAEAGNVVSKFGYLDVESMNLPAGHVDAYLGILEEAEALAPMPARGSLIACLHKEKEVQEMFAGIFRECDVGNFEAAKDFIVTDAYVGLRDAFLGDGVEYWTGETNIPVSREYVKLKRDGDTWTFSFPGFGENESTAGVITIWAVDMKDNGVLRTSISYEPAKQSEEYFPHTEYIISYMYSNLQKSNGFLYEMNYHFETRTWTEEGITTHLIGGWGGPYQWEKSY